jgi:hypothetical protein
MKTRSEVLKWVCDHFPNHGKAVELGVKQGEFSREILTKWRGDLFMIDAWKHFSTDYDDIANVSDADHFQFMGSSIANTAWAGDRANTMRCLSLKAAGLFQNDSFDWVYIDAAHDYANVFNDLTAWWPLVRDGGILWGDDYLEGRHFNSQFGVKTALEDFLRKHAVTKFFHNEGASEGIPQWVIVK